MGLTPRQLFVIIIIAILSSDILTLIIFMFSRNDPNLRVAALVSSGNVAIAFVAIASTLLTGKDLTGRHESQDMADLPPGSVKTSTDTVQTPPVTIDPNTSPKA